MVKQGNVTCCSFITMNLVFVLCVFQGQRNAYIPQATGMRPQGRFQQMGGPRGQAVVPNAAFGGSMHNRPGANPRRFPGARTMQGQPQPGPGQPGRGGAPTRGAPAGGKGPRPMGYAGGPPPAAAAAAAAPAGPAAAAAAPAATVPPARNVPLASGAAAPSVPAAQAQAAPAAPANGEGKTEDGLPDMKTLSSLSSSDQKQVLGEHLFLRIKDIQPDLAGKITGMLLEIDNAEILHMLESPDSLKAKIAEAVEVLKAHQQQQGKGDGPSLPAAQS